MDDEKADALARFESRCARLAESQGLSTELVRDAILDPTPEEAVTWQARHGVDEVSDYDVSTIQAATARASAVLRGERHMVQVFDVWLANARRIRSEGHYDPKPAPVEAAAPAPDLERERLLSELGLACEALAKEHMVSAELMRDALLDPGPGATWQATHGVERVVDLPVGTLRVAVGRTASDPGARDHWLNQARALRPKQYARPAVPAVAATEPRGARLNIVLAFGDGLDPDAVAREFMAGLESTGLKPREMALDQENELQRVKDERDSVAHRLATVIRERDQLQAELNALSDRVAQGGGDTYEKLEVACFILAPLVKGKHVPAPILRAVADILNLPK